MSDSGSSGPPSNNNRPVQKAGEFIKVRWLEIVGILIIAAVLGDLLISSGQIFVNGIRNWANSNKGFASIILSALLLFAYILQFRSNDRQRVLMQQQKNIMTAGYTPVIGVLSQETQDYTDDDTEQASEKLLLKIVNRGNSIARDLKIRFELEHNSPQYSSNPNSEPLMRVEDGKWWTSGSGGSLSHEEDITKFDVKVRIYLEQEEPLTIPEVAEKLFEDSEESIDKFSVVTHLTYKDAMDNSERMRLNTYHVARPLGESTAKISNATKDAKS